MQSVLRVLPDCQLVPEGLATCAVLLQVVSFTPESRVSRLVPLPTGCDQSCRLLSAVLRKFKRSGFGRGKADSRPTQLDSASCKNQTNKARTNVLISGLADNGTCCFRTRPEQSCIATRAQAVAGANGHAT